MNKESTCRSLRPLREKVAEGRMRGFTLIELLVVVMIIAILAAIAVPQYKHAALKSRFSTVMPMAKSIADAQEVYYQGRQMYALDVDELDVTPINAENTSVALSTQAEEDKFAYVAANRSDVEGARYIVYQKHSPKFAGNIHCEAAADNEDALWLCEKGLNGQEIEGSIRDDGSKTYLLEGSANGENDYFPKLCSGNGEKACDCGGPVMGSCDEKTGSWSYETDCPQPQANQTVECGAGYTGTKTRQGNVCKNGAYTYGNWDTSNCVADPNTCPGTKPTSSTGVYNCVNGQWFYTRTSGGTSTGNSCDGGSAGFACTDRDYYVSDKECRGSGVKACSSSIFSGAQTHCSGNGLYGCSGSTFSGYRSVCMGSAEYACAGSIFSGNKSHCAASLATQCIGATFESGSYCTVDSSSATGACVGTYKPGSWCAYSSGGRCPAGSPAGTTNGPYSSGACWDGNGNLGTQYCTQS